MSTNCDPQELFIRKGNKGKSSCKQCKQPINDTAPRVSPNQYGFPFFHPRCAVEWFSKYGKKEFNCCVAHPKVPLYYRRNLTYTFQEMGYKVDVLDVHRSTWKLRVIFGDVTADDSDHDEEIEVMKPRSVHEVVADKVRKAEEEGGIIGLLSDSEDEEDSSNRGRGDKICSAIDAPHPPPPCGGCGGCLACEPIIRIGGAMVVDSVLRPELFLSQPPINISSGVNFAGVEEFGQEAESTFFSKDLATLSPSTVAPQTQTRTPFKSDLSKLPNNDAVLGTPGNAIELSSDEEVDKTSSTAITTTKKRKDSEGGVRSTPDSPSKKTRGGSNKITYFDVSFQEKELAKDLGAKWDPKARCWYMPAHCDEEMMTQMRRKFHLKEDKFLQRL